MTVFFPFFFIKGVISTGLRHLGKFDNTVESLKLSDKTSISASEFSLMALVRIS